MGAMEAPSSWPVPPTFMLSSMVGRGAKGCGFPLLCLLFIFGVAGLVAHHTFFNIFLLYQNNQLIFENLVFDRRSPLNEATIIPRIWTELAGFHVP